MNKVKARTLILLLLAAVLALALALFFIFWEEGGASWALSSFNSHVYKDGVFISGQVADRKGKILLKTEDQQRVYQDDAELRRATLHVVGDVNGNIGGSAQGSFQQQLAGYTMINGLYSMNGKGRTLTLTIDAELNRTAYQALAGRNGCVAVYNYRSGQVLCLVSAPGFDPADAPSAESLTQGEYLNRVLSATFTPGSTFKLVTLAAAIENLDDLFSRHFTCTGSCTVGNGQITCPEVHGEMDIYAALANSCNCVFAQLGEELGSEVLLQYAEKMGLLDSFPVSGYQTAAGSFTQAAAGSVDIGWSAVGQYQDLVCPAALLRMVGAIANKGQAVDLRLVKKVSNTWGFPTQLPELSTRNRLLSSATADLLKEMMLNNVAVKYGAQQFPDLAIGAKSGTAEVGGNQPHAWFAGFLDDPLHPYAFVVLVENGGSGSQIAGSVANQVLQAAVK